MYLVAIVLPLLASVVAGFFGRKVGVSGAQLITCLSIIITTLIAIITFVEVSLNNVSVSISLFRWIDTESLNIMWGFNFDSLTVTMLIPVLIISSLVHIYSVGYMSHDPHNQRFFSYLSLFTFMMIILVTANNFLLMFVGWEGVGVCSYLLVNFWYTRIAANQSSISAFLTNRVGDCFLTIGMFTIIWTFGNLDYSTVFSLSPFINENAISLIGICLLIGAMAKSSQVGLHVWLPLAMEGPTPVSALIHAATMVTAGVYLLMRCSPLIEYSSTVLILCLWIGSITTLFSSLIGLFQQDIKKVIAYSTMSQLGMMVIAVGLSCYNLALFHLVNHAFYKGLLFLGAGAVIHAVSDNQDFRKYGGLITFLPLSYTVMLIASLSLVAFPFMTGFYSKDFILESAFGQFNYYGITVYFVATIGAMFTTMYSVKVLYLTFIAKPNGSLLSYKNAHESDIYMSIPLIILALFSIFFGHICKDMFIGLGTGLFADNSLFIHPMHESALTTEFGVSTMFKLLPFFFTISLIIVFVYLLEIVPKIICYFKVSRLGYNLFNFFSLRFLIEFIYNRFVTRFMLKMGGQTTKVLDKGSVELLGPYGLEVLLVNLSKTLSKLDSGVVTSYALYILVGLISYMLIPYVFYNDINSLVLILCILASLFASNL
uniref:NADH-ubiquinone oxidoreductase chain 5 n=1 Tax=Bacidia sorediata TaxID=1885590 RepID=A0A515MN26_9LECA|nr:NADH dehydrogenase subunit 5 [Bacidia sorediata]